MTVYLRALTDDGLVCEVAEPFKFPGGEWHLKDINKDIPIGATWIADVRGASVDDLVVAALLADVAHGRVSPFVLMLPYLPAARSDRGLPAGAYVYGRLVQAMNPQQVIAIDAHSPVMGRTLPTLTELDPTAMVERAFDHVSHFGRYDAVIAPDKGAAGRAKNVAYALGLDYIECEKHRDFDTGRITSLKIRQTLPKSGTYLVVDDICDGGGTFKMLAAETGLDHQQLGLWVTHGIFSGAAVNLRSSYRHIYTTDSHPGARRPGCATVITPVETYMLQNVKSFSG